MVYGIKETERVQDNYLTIINYITFLKRLQIILIIMKV